MPPKKAIKIFYCYSDSEQDEQMQQKLEKHLSTLTWEGAVISWHKDMISAGKEWESEIDANLKTADIILVLISSEFTASHYHWNVLAKQAMEQHVTRKALVITILLRPVDNYWKFAFPNVKVLPEGEIPITGWKPHDRAFANITKGIREEVEKLTDPNFAIKKSFRLVRAGVKPVANCLVNGVKGLVNVAYFTLSSLTRASRSRRRNRTGMMPFRNPVIMILGAAFLASQVPNLLGTSSSETKPNYTLISTQKENHTGWIWIGLVKNTSGRLSVGERLLKPLNPDLFPSIDPPVIPSPGAVVTVKYEVNLRKEQSLLTPLDKLQRGEKIIILKVEPLAKYSQNSPNIKVRAQVRKCNQTCNN